VEQSVRRLSKEAKWSIGSFVVIVVAVGAVLMSLGSGGGMCGNDVWSEKVSPDGKWKAVVFVVDCGATTTNKETAPRVSILRADQQLSQSDGGNVFGVGPTDKAKRPSVRADWTGGNELMIGYAEGGRIFKQATKYKDITIKYVPEPLIR
jgi:hypothetical protein